MNATDRSLTRRLAEEILLRPVPGEARDRARLYLRDALACAAGARRTRPAAIVRGWAAPRLGEPGTWAFALGAHVHVLELDDLHRASVTHPGCVVVPAALAAARSVGAGLDALLDAVVRGYEACLRVGEAVGPAHYRIFHNTATCGPFGAAAAAGSLLGLGADALVAALGNAGTVAGGLWQFNAEGAMSKHLHAGHAARTGLVAAELAAAGLTGPESILEGARGFFAGLCPDARPAAVLAPPSGDRSWKIGETSLKPWPSCRHTHPAIDAAFAARRTLGERSGDPAAVTEVRVTTYAAARDVCDRVEPLSPYQAGFSLQHCVAVALVDGAVGPASFDETRLGDPDLAALRRRIRIEVGEPFRDAYPGRWGARVEVVLDDRSSQAAESLDARGDPELPLDPPAHDAKIAELFERGGWHDDEHARPIAAFAGPAVPWESLDRIFRDPGPA